jgi:type IV pilus assembly protein PilM
MEILPKTLGTRPRLACEVRAEGVVAARAEDASAVLSAVSRVPLAEGVVVPHLRTGEAGVTVASPAGNSAANGFVGSAAAGAAGRATLVAAVRSALEAVSLKTREVTLVVPDSAVRVLLLDFDELPTKEAEALPVVRFRLKKLLPFDADDAAVSFQVMGTTRGVMQVIAVAMPREVQTDYESVVREAGFEPGAILPSTLAALAGLDEGERPRLVVNAGREGVTTAIVKGGLLLLHRTVDLGTDLAAEARSAEPAAVQDAGAPAENSISAIAARLAAAGAHAPVGSAQVPVVASETVFEGSATAPASEVAQAVSVAAAYFEDTLDAPPAVVMAAGTLGAESLVRTLDEASAGMGMATVAVQEMVDRQMLGDGAASAGKPGGVPLGWLAGVRGALAN